jgi:hypothetical protein
MHRSRSALPGHKLPQHMLDALGLGGLLLLAGGVPVCDLLIRAGPGQDRLWRGYIAHENP